MNKYKIVFDAPFSNPEIIIEANSLEEAQKIADKNPASQYLIPIERVSDSAVVTSKHEN